MKKLFLIPLLAITVAKFSSGQQWVYFPEGIPKCWVNIGEIDIPGEFVSLEALVTIKDTGYAARNIISKHFEEKDCNYLLRDFRFEITTTSGYCQVTNPKKLCQDSTYHLAGTYDGDSAKYFVNGVQVASQQWSGLLVQNNFTAAIGNISTDGFNEQQHGYIDEVRIWNIARTAEEIAANMYDLPDPTFQYGLLAYYKFEGNYINLQGNSIFDGIPVGAELKDTLNPFFNGTVSTHFCNPLGMQEHFNISLFKVNPNPSDGHFHVELIKPVSGLTVLTVYNLLGKKIGCMALSANSTEIELNEPDGLYLVSVSTLEETYTTRILISHK